ncbi:MAG: hypothetical protein ACLFPF_10370 [Halanaerobiales bacterium]
MKKIISIIVISVLMVSFSFYVFAESSLTESGSTFEIRTIEGTVRAQGTDPRPLYTFLSDDGERFVLWDGLTERIALIKQFKLVLTGKVYDNVMIPLDYDVVNNTEDHSVFIGQVYSNNRDVILVTENQQVIKINKGLSGNEANFKCLVRGNYTSTGEYEGEMDVIDFIVLEYIGNNN